MPEIWKLLPDDFQPYAWQPDCLRIWANWEYRGTVKMATEGGDRVRFALAAAQKLQNEKNRNLRLVVVVPTIVQMDQWHNELRKSNIPSACIGRLGGGHVIDDPGTRIIISVTNSARDKLSPLIERWGWSDKLFLIVDECHRYNTSRNSKIFESSPTYTLGLSVTPWESDEASGIVTDGGHISSPVGRWIGPTIYRIPEVDGKFAEAVANERFSESSVERTSSRPLLEKKIIAGCLAGCVAAIFAFFWLVCIVWEVVKPWVFDWHYSMGERHYRLEKYEAVVTYLDQVLQDDPNRPTAHYYKGIARGILEDTGGAITDLNRALDLGVDKTKTSWAYYNLGISMAQLGQLSSALHYYDKAIETHPAGSPPEFYYNRGIAYLGLGHEKDAENDGRKVLRSVAEEYLRAFVCGTRGKFRGNRFRIRDLLGSGSLNPSQIHQRRYVSLAPKSDKASQAKLDEVLDFLRSDSDCSR